MWMMFVKCFVVGFGLMLGIETALGLCLAFGNVTKEASKK
jgi:hypothetical protein